MAFAKRLNAVLGERSRRRGAGRINSSKVEKVKGSYGMEGKQKGLIMGVLALFIVGIMLMGCGKSPEPAKPAAPKPAAPVRSTKVSVGILKLTSTAPIFIGMDKGFFKEQGIEIEPQWFDAAHPIAVATASNKVQVGATGITASLFNMVAGGQKLTIVADKGREQKGYSSSALVMRTDLWNAGAKKLEDLKGKRVGITQTGSTFHYMLDRKSVV